MNERGSAGRPRRIDQAAELVRAASERVNATARGRDTPGGMERWHAALFELDAAMRQLYPPDLDDKRLTMGDPASIEAAVTFLERDPWAFGTGYMKERILSRLNRADLSPGHAARLRSVILERLEGPYRREFRRYCLIAPRVADDAFRLALLERLRSSELRISHRALRVLETLGEPTGAADRAIAQRIIEEVSGSPASWHLRDWLGQAVRCHRDPAWMDHLFERASDRGTSGEQARWLIEAARVRPTDGQRESLASVLLAGARGEVPLDDSLALWRLANSETLRAGLLDAYLGTHDDDRGRRLSWIIDRIARRTRGAWPGLDP